MKAALDEDVGARPTFQLCICPVVDNTATRETGWKDSQDAPWLTPERMQWYRARYFAGPEAGAGARSWDASPCFAPREVLALSPRTFIGVAGCDLLAPEGERFAEQLVLEGGVDVRVEVYEGTTHPILVLAG